MPSVEGRVPAETILDALDSRTRLVALSWVEFSTGYRLDLKAIGQACRERGIWLAVDAMQGLGVLPFDVREFNVDFFGAASHKWLLGPGGVGWLYCRSDLIDLLSLGVVGQGSYVRESEETYLDYDLPLWPDARRFQPGMANAAGVAGLEATLDVFNEVGMERVAARIKHLTDTLATGLTERGYRLAVRRGHDDWSGIVSFSKPDHPSDALARHLDGQGISVSVREGCVRLSPHFFNNDEEVSRFFDALPH